MSRCLSRNNEKGESRSKEKTPVKNRKECASEGKGGILIIKQDLVRYVIFINLLYLSFSRSDISDMESTEEATPAADTPEPGVPAPDAASAESCSEGVAAAAASEPLPRGADPAVELVSPAPGPEELTTPQEPPKQSQ
jgi:hypothetical protein